MELDSFVRKAAFALRFGDWNLIVSNFLTSDSRIVFERDIRDRVDKLAPFLQCDADPYPVVQDGRVVYIWDALHHARTATPTPSRPTPPACRRAAGSPAAASTTSATR